MPLEEPDDELPDDRAPVERDPPELELDFDPLPELGRLMVAPPLLVFVPRGYVVAGLLLVDPDRVAVEPLEPDEREGALVTPVDPRPCDEELDRVPVERVPLLVPLVKEPRERHESSVLCERVELPDALVPDDELIRAPPIVVMTRCAGSVDPAFPLRHSSFEALVESLREGARLTG